jgi:hypothetical protein
MKDRILLCDVLRGSYPTVLLGISRITSRDGGLANLKSLFSFCLLILASANVISVVFQASRHDSRPPVFPGAMLARYEWFYGRLMLMLGIHVTDLYSL